MHFTVIITMETANSVRGLHPVFSGRVNPCDIRNPTRSQQLGQTYFRIKYWTELNSIAIFVVTIYNAIIVCLLTQFMNIFYWNNV